MGKKGFRGWCFTINNYTDDDLAMVKALKYVYLLYAFEVGEENQVPHIQGYVYFKDEVAMSALSKKLKRAHLEIANGNASDNRIYIVGPYEKNGKVKPYNPDHFEFGEMPVGQGKRSDLDSMRESLRENPSMRIVTANATSYQSVRMAEVFLKYHEKVRTQKTKIIWLYGETGTGKSHTALSLCDANDTYHCMDTGRWFDGYDAHKYVIVDDVRPDFMSFKRMLNLMDYTPFRVETKGGTRQFLAETVIFTSPLSPSEFCLRLDSTEDPNQFVDRIDVIKKFSGRSRRVNAKSEITIWTVKE